MKPLTVVNAATATFDCSFGRGCEGLCCKEGEPSVTPVERETIEAQLHKVRPHLRPEALAVLDSQGWIGEQIKLEQPMVRVVDQWCLFFNQGCTLHKVGLMEGDFAKYKPIQCILFPLEPNGDGSWYVRQWDTEGEEWDVFCLNPKNTTRKAVEALAPEMEVAAKLGDDFTWDRTEDALRKSPREA